MLTISKTPFQLKKLQDSGLPLQKHKKIILRQLWPKAINRWCLNTFNLITIYGYILRKTKPPPYTFLQRVYVLLLLIRSFCLQHDDLSPFEIKIQALESQIEELTASIKSDQQLWLRQQGELVALTQELETNNKQMIKLQTENTGMQQKKIRLDGTTPQNVTFLPCSTCCIVEAGVSLS